MTDHPHAPTAPNLARASTVIYTFTGRGRWLAGYVGRVLSWRGRWLAGYVGRVLSWRGPNARVKHLATGAVHVVPRPRIEAVLTFRRVGKSAPIRATKTEEE